MLKGFIKNVSYLVIIQISNTLLPLIIMPYLARIITPEQYGDIEFTRIFCYYFSIVILFGFDFTATRDISIHRDDKDQVNDIISQTTYAKIILFIICSITFFIIIFSVPSFNSIYCLLITTYLINIGYAFYPLWFFQGTENLKLVTTLSFLIRFFIIVITMVLIRKEEDYWIFNFLQGISLILISITCYLLLKYKYGFKFTKYNLKKVKTVLKDGMPLFLSIILVTVMTSLFFLFLKLNSDANEMAKFSTSNKIIATIQSLLLLPFTQAFFPIITKQADENLSLFKRNIKIVALALLIITFLTGLIIFFFGDIIIMLIFGEKYLLGFESLKILAFLPMFASLTNVFAYQGLLSLKKDKLFLAIHIVYAIFSVLISLYLIKNYNAYLASIIRLVIEILLFLTAMIFYFKSTGNKQAVRV
ncbi:oligosaccharide flippase family protein [Flavobacterium microcysteis]|uniref:Flippase n=1 Tax=Flavobacterium microcysteis TaxID=2596891 RepID=A0A501QIZ2_9FLAO|nr:oligosaccharide flippase family protein [Flavobacterium microcysteis]TPD71956.1 hypothetical protein FJA49_03480 [Flavobacterium microcysteis]